MKNKEAGYFIGQMWARKRTTGRVTHCWHNPYPGQKDVWQMVCMGGPRGESPMRNPIKVPKGDHDQFFVLEPTGAARCRSCTLILNWEPPVSTT